MTVIFTCPSLFFNPQRVSVERDSLKEHLEELKCQKSAQSSDPRTDLPHDLLGTDPQDVWYESLHTFSVEKFDFAKHTTLILSKIKKIWLIRTKKYT